MKANELEKTLAILERIAGGYPTGSEEEKAIKLAAEVVSALSCLETRHAFVKFMSEMGRPLSKAKQIYLRSIGIDLDTFEELEDEPSDRE